MDEKLNAQIKAYLDAASEERSLEQGNLLLLKLSGSRIRYNMIARQPEKFAAFIEKQLTNFYNFRIRRIQHEDVVKMERKVEKIFQKRTTDSDRPGEAPDCRRTGLRADHASLPEEIQLLFDKNLEILVRMRRLHKELRDLSLASSPCPDSERYPFLKELIALDKEMHENWKKYDTYIPENA